MKIKKILLFVGIAFGIFIAGGFSVKTCQNNQKKEAILNKTLASVHFKDAFVRDNRISQNQKSIIELREEAEKGDVNAQYVLANLYRIESSNNRTLGKKSDKNYKEAIKWLLKAANQGDVKAQCDMGYIYAYGDGVPRNLEEAEKWFHKSTEGGDPEAQCLLGCLYAIGHGVLEDPKEAAKWFKKASEQGNDLAQYNLGILYARGDGVSKDLVESYAYILLSTRKRHDDILKAALKKILSPSQREAGLKRAKEIQK